jgi:AmmeMemoRadiSam system protein B/AmmeMemoRadiSam system protein A
VRIFGEVDIMTLYCSLRRVSWAWVLTALSVSVFARAGVLQEGGNAAMGSSKVREPAVAGSFYPGSEKALRDAVSSMLEEAKPAALGGRVVGLIAPHAGYMYSGQVAAYAYNTVRGKHFDAVIVVAPSHRMYFEGSSIYREGPYLTPLGLVPIAADIADAIAKADPSVVSRPEAHTGEHSLEVQLPFLQVAVPDLKIVPIIMGDQSLDNCKRLAGAMASAAKGKNVLLVASTDLSHFHDYDQAMRLDNSVIALVGSYDPEGLARALAAGSCEACGGGPVIAVMLAARQLGATRAVILNHANSGDVTGDRSSVVGYMAAALVGEGAVGVDLGLNEQEKADLLRIARQSITAKLSGKPVPEFKITSERLKKQMGAFVTLTEDGELRGCIGHIIGTQPLHRTISDMAIAAATEDPRFSPVEAGELNAIAIEISVLTPLRRITDPEEIMVGRDGIYIEKGLHRGLLLPQVATEYGWDTYEFLDNTCLKAGLPRGSWREGANIQIFSAQVFNEGEMLKQPPSK